ncbi:MULTISPECIES: hypothetical protein [unclassified Cupriavidus]|uniref:hypothetical protein n=1 Tax=unclassified Cupriavidus TaxID=2640874 RepID=UPI0013658B3E|nr:hypothetical protein [Cupriavidus sp. SW-Y-13]MWL87385.1 hypothetical protein [Cupriavidus sp. SW-Y-13]
MSRLLAVLLLTLATYGAAHAVTKCQGDRETLYTSGACPSGYRDVTSSMKGKVTTVTKSPKVRKDEQDYLTQRARLSQQIENWDAREDELAMRSQTTFWNQCRALEFQARASERAMERSEYWSHADRYRDAARALRAEQYSMGCYF